MKDSNGQTVGYQAHNQIDRLTETDTETDKETKTEQSGEKKRQTDRDGFLELIYDIHPTTHHASTDKMCNVSSIDF